MTAPPEEAGARDSTLRRASHGHFVCLGGGGFGADPEEAGVERYALRLAVRDRPRVCHLPTASGDSDHYVARFYATFQRFDCEPHHLSLFGAVPQDLAAFLDDMDVIHVGGGNTRSMLAVWREWGLDDALARSAGRGTVLMGVSAGAVCWFDRTISGSIANQVTVQDCLGLLQGTCVAHYENGRRREAFLGAVARGEVAEGYGIEEGAALHVAADGSVSAVSVIPGRTVYMVRRVENGAVETALADRLLQQDGRFA